MIESYHGIEIDNSLDRLIDPVVLEYFQEKYSSFDGETMQQGLARTALAFCGDDLGLAQRMYGYASKKWIMFATPVLSNSRIQGGTGTKSKNIPLPISCFLAYVPDTIDGLRFHENETVALSIRGGGVGGHWSDVRPPEPNGASGVLGFLRPIDTLITVYKQGKTRNGAYAAYLDITHPEIENFILGKVPTGGDHRAKSLNLQYGVNLTDAFMDAVQNDYDFDLINPHTKAVAKTVKARELWRLLIQTRARIGTPYFSFIDTANRALNPHLQRKGLRIRGSNLCNEIYLPTDHERTAVCCLSSVNLEYYEDWKHTTLIEDSITFLDNVLETFIRDSEGVEYLRRARFSAQRERSLGLGVMGYHYYLIRHAIPFESEQARVKNQEMFRLIQERARASSRELAKLRGIPEDLRGSTTIEAADYRNAHLIALAPTTNSSIFLETSPSIEPIRANIYTQRIRVKTYVFRNRYLEPVLERYGMNRPEVWNHILLNFGSVQDLEFLTENERKVFRTADEISQDEIIRQAGERQPFICQGQSLNLFFASNADVMDIHRVHFNAWRAGVKGLYYLRTFTNHDVGRTGELRARSQSSANELLAQAVRAEQTSDSDQTDDSCEMCQG